jgi:hypothetical protein
VTKQFLVFVTKTEKPGAKTGKYGGAAEQRHGSEAVLGDLRGNS